MMWLSGSWLAQTLRPTSRSRRCKTRLENARRTSSFRDMYSKKQYFFMFAMFWLMWIVAIVSHAHAQLLVDELVIHLVPHSHVEHGFVDTVDASRTQQVERILSQVTAQLRLDPSRRFVWGELFYFAPWYDKQSLTTKTDVQTLVSNGQFEFVGGNMVEHDETLTTFNSIVDAISNTHDWLKVNFDHRPRIAWQIDNAGHSDVTPAMYAQMGYDAVCINRIQPQLLQHFKSTQHLQFLWQGAPIESIRVRDSESRIFTHVLLDGYRIPDGFDFEAPGVRQVVTPSRRAKHLVKILMERARYYKTRHLLVPFGDDFRFMAAEKQFTNWDKLLRYINEKVPNVRIQYATAREYIDAVRSTSALTQMRFPVFYGDLVPYADADDSFWVGLYSSRPALKLAIRELQSLVRSANVLYALARVRSAAVGDLPMVERIESGQVLATPQTVYDAIDLLFHDLSEAQATSALVNAHHTIAGTLRAHVVDDMLTKIAQARVQADNVVAGAVSVLLSMRKSEFSGSGPRVRPQLGVIPFRLLPHGGSLGDSSRDSSASGAGGEKYVNHPVILHNTQLFERVEVVRMKLHVRWKHARNLRVVDTNGKSVACQVHNVLIPAVNVDKTAENKATSGLNEQRSVDDAHEGPTKGEESQKVWDTEVVLYFLARVPPLGISTYFIEATTARDRVQRGRAKSAAATPVTRVYEIQDGEIVVNSDQGGTTGGKKEGASKNMRGGSKPGESTLRSIQSSIDGVSIMNELPVGEQHPDGPVLENSAILLEFTAATGMLKAITDKRTQRRTLLNQQLRIYASTREGAFVFRPEPPVSDPLSLLGKRVIVTVVNGPLVKEIHVMVSNGFQQTVRVFVAQIDLSQVVGSNGDVNKKGGNGSFRGKATGDSTMIDPNQVLELEGHAHIDQRVIANENTDVVFHLDTSMRTEGRFLTDNSIGNLIERSTHRDGPLASNFYPATSAAGLQDNEPTATSRMGQTLMVLFRTPHAVASPLRPGVGGDAGILEAIIHRNHANDDGKGLGQGLIDFGPASVHALLTVDIPEAMRARLPQLRFRHLNPLTVLYATQQPGAEQLLARKNWLSRFHGQMSYGAGSNGNIMDSSNNGNNIASGSNGNKMIFDSSGYMNGGDLELLSLSPRNAYSDELVLRVRNTRQRNGYASSNQAGGSGRGSDLNVLQLDMAKIFRNDFIVTNVQIRSLALSESAAVLASARIGSSFLAMEGVGNGIGGGGGDRYSGGVMHGGGGGRQYNQYSLDSDSAVESNIIRDTAIKAGHRGGKMSSSAASSAIIPAGLLATLDLETGGPWSIDPQQVMTFCVNVLALTDEQLRQHASVFESGLHVGQGEGSKSGTLSTAAAVTESTPDGGNSVSADGKKRTRGGTKGGRAKQQQQQAQGADDSVPDTSSDILAAANTYLSEQLVTLEKKMSLAKKKKKRLEKNVKEYHEEIEMLRDMDTNNDELSTALLELKRANEKVKSLDASLKVLEREYADLQPPPATTLDGMYLDRPLEYRVREKEAEVHGVIAGAGGMLVVMIAVQWMLGARGRKKKQAFVPVQLTGSVGSGAGLPTKRL